MRKLQKMDEGSDIIVDPVEGEDPDMSGGDTLSSQGD